MPAADVSPAPAAAYTPTNPAPASTHASSGTSTAADPMAPRRDAPIFRLQPQGQVAPAPRPPAGPAPGQQGARYYSVHRDAGRQPDPTVIPDPVFFDSVTLDLARPPETEPPLRDAQGRRRAVANNDPSLP